MRSFVDMNLYVVRLYPVAACSLIALHYAVFIAYFLSLKYRNIVFVWISRKRRCKHYVRSFKHLLFGCVHKTVFHKTMQHHRMHFQVVSFTL